VIKNESTALARDIKWAVVLWNRDLPDRNDPLPIPVSSFDWIKPQRMGGPQNLFGRPDVSALIKKGDRLIGTASIDCATCECTQERSYIFSFRYGEGGWFAEVGSDYGGLLVPKNFTKVTREKYFKELESLIPKASRTKIAKSE